MANLRPRHPRQALAFLGLSIALLGAAARAEAAPPADFFGMETPDAVFYHGFGDASYRTSTLDRQRAAGVGLIRQPFYWSHVETQRGVYSFSTYDAFVGEAAKRGIRVMPVLFGESSFYTSRPPGGNDPGTYPPTAANYSKLGDYGAALVRRYGPNGTYWDQNPSVPKLPVRSYQVWNEPHIQLYWPNGVSPAQYSQLLLAATPRIKAADPNAEVVAAGISDVPGLPGAQRLADFVRGMYSNGAAGGFDTLAVHPYAKEPSGVMAIVEQARALMVQNNDSASKLWVTEYSWGSAGQPSDSTTDEAGQAAKTRALMTAFATRRTQLNLRGAIWWLWRDSALNDFWTSYTGLVRSDNSIKPVLAAFRSVARALPSIPTKPPVPGPTKPVTSQPSDLTAPTVRLSLRLRQRLGRLRSRGLVVEVRCSEACRIQARLLLSRRVARRFRLAPRRGSAIVGRGSSRLGAAGKKRVGVKLTRTARRRLSRVRRLRLTLRVVVTDPVGNARTVNRTLTVRR